MAIHETDKIDGLGYNEEKSSIGLLLTDHLEWSEKDEHSHLILLQNKINAYISFIETKQYISIYPDKEIKNAVFDIRFKHEITENCRKFLHYVQGEVGSLGIIIEVNIG